MYSLIIGAGFSGRWIGKALAQHGAVAGSGRTPESLKSLGFDGLVFDASDPLSTLPSSITEAATHLILSVAPGREAPLDEPVLTWLRQQEGERFPSLRWIAYLSTIGVYGDQQGQWIDEEAPCTSVQPRSIMRLEAENAWREQARQMGVPISILRLSGIYGPGRNAIKDAINGRDRMILKEGQVFNRIHVADLAQAVTLAALKRFDGVINVTDDEPAPPQDVIRHAHALVNKTPPVGIPFEDADLSPMGRSFYSENKRVSNARSKTQLGMTYQYPNYRAGLKSLLDNGY